MRMTTCTNGHYYDNETNASCPYCSGGAVDNITKKTALAGGGGSMGNETKRTEVAGGNSNSGTSIFERGSGGSTGNETVYMSANGNKEDAKDTSSPTLLSGWLVITSEDGKGSSFPLTFAMNSIGREKRNHIHINIDDNSISREKHAMIIYDYQNNLFFVKHGEGQYLSYLNGSVLLENRELKANDRLKVGNTELIFIPLCSENFNWED